MIRLAHPLLIVALFYNSPAVAQQWNIKQDIDPAKVVGHEACAECHKSEVAGWKLTSHFKKAHGLLLQKEAKDIAAEVQVQDVMTDRRCTTCHGTQQEKNGQFTVLKAVSCESCHGAGGSGDQDWLKIHASYGDGAEVKREEESKEHFAKRLTQCDQQGMRRSENLYDLAKNCFECHVVPSEQLVNDGKHPAGSETIEFVAWAQGEVRHNFRLNQNENAVAPTLWTNARFTEGRTADGHRRLMYVVGHLADLEVSLRNRGSATGRGNFLTAINKRISDAQKELKSIAKAGPVPELAAIPDVKRGQLRRPKPGDDKLFNGFADQVAAIGKKLASTADKNTWDDIGLPKSAKGAVYLGK